MSDLDAETVLIDVAPALLGYFRRRVETPEDAADLVNETVIAVWRAAHRMPADEQAARMWIFGFARNTLRHHRRSSSRRDALTTRLASRIDPGPWEDQGVGVEVREAISALPDELGELIRLAHWDGFSLEEIAQLTGVSPSTVRTRHARAKELLRASLSEVSETAKAARQRP